MIDQTKKRLSIESPFANRTFGVDVRAKTIAKFVGAVVSVFMLALAGCQTEQIPSAELVEVVGEVYLDGAPLADARVLFVPTSTAQESKFALSYGETDADGTFVMRLRDGTDGAIEGMHHVYFSRIEKSENESTPTETAQLDEEDDSDPEYDAEQALQEIVSGSIGQSAQTFHEKWNNGGEQIPGFYNRSSEEKFHVVAGRGVLRPKFELSSVDPLLIEKAGKRTNE